MEICDDSHFFIAYLWDFFLIDTAESTLGPPLYRIEAEKNVETCRNAFTWWGAELSKKLFFCIQFRC